MHVFWTLGECRHIQWLFTQINDITYQHLINHETELYTLLKVR